MSQENVEIVREQFEATNRNDFAAPMADWADDIEVVNESRGGHPLALMAGTHSGRDAVGEFFGEWFRSFRPVYFELLEVRGAGDAVAVAARHRARGRQSGVETEEDVFYVYRLRESKIVQIKFHDSWSDALEAAGLSG